MGNPLIAAVVVAFQPEPGSFVKSIMSILPQVGMLCIANNGGFVRSWLPDDPRIHVIDMGWNSGIAAGQNAGIAQAKRSGARFVLLFDQDSIAAPDMVGQLFAAFQERTAGGAKVAACGPRYTLAGGHGPSRFLASGSFAFREILPEAGIGSVCCDFLISSGMLLPIDVLDRVGAMDESLFIDHVDTEWCFRAAAQGFRCYGVPNAFMLHNLGMSCRTFRLGKRDRRLPKHPALRYYFIFRNSMLLRRREYMPVAWRRHDLLRLAGLLTFQGLSPRGGFAILRMSFRGIADGLRGRSGSGPSA